MQELKLKKLDINLIFNLIIYISIVMVIFLYNAPFLKSKNTLILNNT